MIHEKEIRKELAKLIEEKKRLCATEKEKNKAVNDARGEINKKYGTDWRSRDYLQASNNTQCNG